MERMVESTSSAKPQPRDLPMRAVVYFVLITFAITWGIAGTYIFFGDWASATFGDTATTSWGRGGRRTRRVN